jgi:hypothetical protein
LSAGRFAGKTDSIKRKKQAQITKNRAELPGFLFGTSVVA